MERRSLGGLRAGTAGGRCESSVTARLPPTTRSFKLDETAWTTPTATKSATHQGTLAAGCGCTDPTKTASLSPPSDIAPHTSGTRLACSQRLRGYDSEGGGALTGPSTEVRLWRRGIRCDVSCLGKPLSSLSLCDRKHGEGEHSGPVAGRVLSNEH